MKYNHVTLVGRVGNDPKVTYTPDGTCVATVSIAMSHSRKKGSEWEEFTEWHNLKFYRKPAESAADHLKKGNLILVDGRLRCQKYQDEHGFDKFYNFVAVNFWHHLESKTARGITSPATAQEAPEHFDESPPPDEDAPF